MLYFLEKGVIFVLPYYFVAFSSIIALILSLWNLFRASPFLIIRLNKTFRTKSLIFVSINVLNPTSFSNSITDCYLKLKDGSIFRPIWYSDKPFDIVLTENLSKESLDEITDFLVFFDNESIYANRSVKIDAGDAPQFFIIFKSNPHIQLKHLYLKTLLTSKKVRLSCDYHGTNLRMLK